MTQIKDIVTIKNALLGALVLLLAPIIGGVAGLGSLVPFTIAGIPLGVGYLIAAAIAVFISQYVLTDVLKVK